MAKEAAKWYEPEAPQVKPSPKTGDADPTAGVPFGPPIKPTDLGSLGPYRVIRAIGKGGMGMVFLGADPKLRRKVALKVMLPKFLAKPTARERFLREARAVAAVENDHIVTIYQVDEANGVPYLALQYLQGATLEAVLREGSPLSLSQLVHVAREVAIGLSAAHEHGVIHRDIKPENIWLEAPDGRVKLIDFGLARLPAQLTNNTADGTVLGTPAYMSPEQARGLEIDARSDLFSLGSVIYRLISGQIPFKGETAFAVVLALTQDAHVPLNVLDPSVPESLSNLVDRLLAKDPNQRPATAKEVAKELKRIEAQVRQPEPGADGPTSKPLLMTTIPVADHGNSAWAGLETDGPSATPSNGSKVEDPPKKKRKLVWPWVLAGVSVAVAAGMALAVFGGSKPVPISTPEPEPSRRNPAKTTSAATVVKPPEPVPLFNGRDLTGWVAAKGGTTDRWKVADGVLRAKAADGLGESLVSEKQYGSFELQFQYRHLGPDADASVAFFVSPAGVGGARLLLADDSNASGFRPMLTPQKQRHGAFFQIKGPIPTGKSAKPIGEWNSMKIANKNSTISVEENGQLINEFDFNTLAEKKQARNLYPGLGESRSPFALQCRAGSVEFKNIRIKE